jgi:flagellar biosynthesis protein FlhB
MAEDQDSKTEDPTGKRLQQARGEGQVGMSRDITTAVSLIATTVVVLLVLPWSLAPLLQAMRAMIEKPQAIRIDNVPDLHHLLADLMVKAAWSLAPALAILAAAGVATTIAQTEGLLWSQSKLKLHFETLNPFGGLQKIFGPKSLVEFLRGLVKVAIVGTAAYLILKPEVMRVTLLIGTPPEAMLALLMDDLRRLLISIILTILGIGVLDYFYQKWQTTRSLKMTKQEVKDEVKNTEGDPHIKGRQRQLRMNRAKKRMLQSVPKASVVVTNPTHYAVALQYEPGFMSAPRVVAKGVDFLAQKIREIALENDVPIVENPPVARALYATVEVDDEISAEHYKAVAEIIGYVMKLKRWKMAG